MRGRHAGPGLDKQQIISHTHVMTTGTVQRPRDEREPMDYRHLPASPPPAQWHATQDVRPLDQGPQRFAFNDDTDLILRYIGMA